MKGNEIDFKSKELDKKKAFRTRNMSIWCQKG